MGYLEVYLVPRQILCLAIHSIIAAGCPVQSRMDYLEAYLVPRQILCLILHSIIAAD